MWRWWTGREQHTHIHTHHAVWGEERDILVKTAFMDHSHFQREGQLYWALEPEKKKCGANQGQVVVSWRKMQRNLKRAVELEKRAWRTWEGRREGERESEREGKGEKDKKRSRETDRWRRSMQPQRGGETKPVDWGSVHAMRAMCSGKSHLLSQHKSPILTFTASVSLPLSPWASFYKMIISNNTRYDFHCCLVSKGSTFFIHLLVITYLFQFFSHMQCCVLGFTVPLSVEVFFFVFFCVFFLNCLCHDAKKCGIVHVCLKPQT